MRWDRRFNTVTHSFTAFSTVSARQQLTTANTSNDKAIPVIMTTGKNNAAK